MVYPIVLAKQPLSFQLRTTAVPTFVSSLEYPINPGVIDAMQSDLNGNATHEDYEFLQTATEDLLNPLTNMFRDEPARRIDYGPDPVNIAFHIWARLIDCKYLEVQFQMSKVGAMSMPDGTIVPRFDTGGLTDTLENYTLGEEIDEIRDGVPQTPVASAFEPLHPEEPSPTGLRQSLWSQDGFTTKRR